MITVSAATFRAAYASRIPHLATLPDEIIQDALLVAQKELEHDIPMYFGNVEVEEREMLEFMGLQESFTFNVQRPPLIKVTDFEFKYNDQRILIDNILDQIEYTKTGMIALLPDGYACFIRYIYGMLIHTRDHIPLGVYIKYNSGLNLDYEPIGEDPAPPTPEQKVLIHAICRRCAIDNILIWASTPGISSKSISMDGISQSSSGGMSDFRLYVELLREQEKKWVNALRREFGLDINFTVL